MSRVGFIGLGNMGGPMAANLVRAGYHVTGFDVVQAGMDAHKAVGGSVASTAAKTIAGAEIVFTMLPAGKHVREVYLGPGGLLAACGDAAPLFVDCSTIDVETARAVAGEAADMLDAPVSGGVGGATAGTLTFMVGGSEDGFRRASPFFAAMGKNIVHAGEAGAGQAAKICNNMLLGISMIGVAEAFVLAERLELDFEKLFRISAASSGQCWSLTTYCPVPGPVPGSPANRDYAPGFATALMLKDLTLAQQAADAVNAATPLGAHAMRLYEAMAEAGLEGKDFSYVFRWLADRGRGGIG